MVGMLREREAVLDRGKTSRCAVAMTSLRAGAD